MNELGDYFDGQRWHPRPNESDRDPLWDGAGQESAMNLAGGWRRRRVKQFVWAAWLMLLDRRAVKRGVREHHEVRERQRGRTRVRVRGSGG
jgi:hypothetical protein